MGQGREKKLVTEEPKPVGSGLTIRKLLYERNTAVFMCFTRIDLWWLFSERMFQVASSPEEWLLFMKLPDYAVRKKQKKLDVIQLPLPDLDENQQQATFSS